MTSLAPLTEAEQAAAEALAAHHNAHSTTSRLGVGAFAAEARAVVAAVGPLLAAEALKAAAADWENQPESVSMKPDVEAWLHRRAAAIRTTTSEKEN